MKGDVKYTIKAWTVALSLIFTAGMLLHDFLVTLFGGLYWINW
jgi:hypothetical protein